MMEFRGYLMILVHFCFTTYCCHDSSSNGKAVRNAIVDREATTMIWT